MAGWWRAALLFALWADFLLHFWMLSMSVPFVTLLSSASLPDEKHLAAFHLVSTNAVKFHWPGPSFQREIGRKEGSKPWS